MEDIRATDLKTILHSKRANLYYLEHCRVLVNGGRVEYLTESGKRSMYWNIPIANTTTLLLGTGTSITQAAMRELAKAGVMVGFCGGGGTPLFAASEPAIELAIELAIEPAIETPIAAMSEPVRDPRSAPTAEPTTEPMTAPTTAATIEIAWLSPQSEYRPTEYLQHWVRFWFNDALRLRAAKAFQQARLSYVAEHWRALGQRHEDGRKLYPYAAAELQHHLDSAGAAMRAATDTAALLSAEGRLTQQLYRLATRATQHGDFVRSKRGAGSDAANQFLDHGNYLAYGLAATAAWVLGLPHGLAVLHGKTRRGGLVFDIADLVKDALILPQAFISAMRGDSEQEFRHACITRLTRDEALDFMIDTVKAVALQIGGAAAHERPA